MPDNLIVPLIMAIAFTGGSYLIHRFERHAASVEHSLTMALICLISFAVAVLIARYAGDAHAYSEALAPLAFPH